MIYPTRDGAMATNDRVESIATRTGIRCVIYSGHYINTELLIYILYG